MVLVLDSTPLIYLGKSDAPEFLEVLDEKRVTSQTVHDEVVKKGKKIGTDDAFLVEKLFEEEKIKIEPIENKKFLENLVKIPGLHMADAEVLALARRLGGTAIIDDEKARNVADLKGIPNHGTAYLLLKLEETGRISKEEARKTLDEMIKEGWKCSTEIYAEILKALGL
ncbi:hypothetical protein AKJ58_00355 [candidate division MSBL1 archaeon SCGC-AAA385D11]|uniref:DUF3368 domain-containing protein n=1 Tax=candidate division MSBL1 archaeon SCGC-AAA385D11 TaxID=1698286 RepID=A0A133VP97_9EURY|nr:hypothetical protein AKJ58_00355 [candidate division MSBL1 archaeon SCGC-AAA385D11]